MTLERAWENFIKTKTEIKPGGSLVIVMVKRSDTFAHVVCVARAAPPQ